MSGEENHEEVAMALAERLEWDYDFAVGDTPTGFAGLTDIYRTTTASLWKI
jgi:hypothetical protein